MIELTVWGLEEIIHALTYWVQRTMHFERRRRPIQVFSLLLLFFLSIAVHLLCSWYQLSIMDKCCRFSKALHWTLAHGGLIIFPKDRNARDFCCFCFGCSTTFYIWFAWMCNPSMQFINAIDTGFLKLRIQSYETCVYVGEKPNLCVLVPEIVCHFICSDMGNYIVLFNIY